MRTIQIVAHLSRTSHLVLGVRSKQFNIIFSSLTCTYIQVYTANKKNNSHIHALTLYYMSVYMFVCMRLLRNPLQFRKTNVSFSIHTGCKRIRAVFHIHKHEISPLDIMRRRTAHKIFFCDKIQRKHAAARAAQQHIII